MREKSRHFLFNAIFFLVGCVLLCGLAIPVVLWMVSVACKWVSEGVSYCVMETAEWVMWGVERRLLPENFRHVEVPDAAEG